jgi:hypothetical protein
MWEPRRLTILWAFMACYRDSFTIYLPFTRQVEDRAFIMAWLLFISLLSLF